MSNRAIKQTLPGQFGWMPREDNGRWTLGVAAPLDYLCRWQLFNLVFCDQVSLEGVTLGGENMLIGNKGELVSIVISQPWHQARDISNPLPSMTEISKFLKNEGFEPVANSFYGWWRRADGILVLDARPDNFIKTMDGIAPIDLPLIQIDPMRPGK